MKLKVIPLEFTVCQVEDYTNVNPDTPNCFPQKTDEENSLVCPTTTVPATKSTHNSPHEAVRPATTCRPCP